jgi:kynureninase
LLKEKCKGAGSNKDLYHFKIITPSNSKERGCQLSLHVKKDGKKLFEEVNKKGIVIDYRNPDVIRITPTPLYNSFEDVYQLCETLKEYCYYEE